MDINIDFDTLLSCLEILKEAFEPYLNGLKNFNFSIFNLLFWVFLAIIFLILLRIWGETRKSFSFCAITALILLASTKVQTLIKDIFYSYDTELVSFLIRLGTLFIVAVVFLYYTAIRNR